ncbi:MAG TPA: sigma-54-dependent Fis family transcriptional regulator [Deltaproteobacteria bacterium]|nr:sigma-54-dependent Fis family transcriptional regulator [Deltaproteobacteria bacterium]
MSSRWLDEVRPLLADRQVDLDEVLSTIVDEIAQGFSADRATFYLVDHSSQQLVSRAAHLPEIAEIRLRLGEGIAGWVGQRGEPIRLSEDTTDPRFNQRIDAVTGYRTRSMLCVPVPARTDDETTIVGVLQVLNKKRGSFTERDLDRLTRLATELAQLLDDTSLRGQLRPDHDKPLAFRFNFIVGESLAMRHIYERIARAAHTEATVLLRGETGTGKTLFARAIHFNSQRRNGPLIKVDCAALPASLIDNELFGHERGAYTGADRTSDGKVAAANGGTLLLDEIGELPLEVQGKLLRLLQERTYLRVGGTTLQHASVRFVCATHVDLEAAVQEGRFRADLYYRLRVVEIEVLPLRQRGHLDLDRLVDHFLYELSRQHGRPGLSLTPEARAALHAWSWPGNVRELEHCIESAVVMTPGRRITPETLPLRRSPGAPGGAGPPPGAFVSELRPLKEIERSYCRHVLALCDGNQTQAAALLQIGRNTLARKLKEP